MIADMSILLLESAPVDVHKGDCGKVLIVAGSREMAGAAIFRQQGRHKMWQRSCQDLHQ